MKGLASQVAHRKTLRFAGFLLATTILVGCKDSGSPTAPGANISGAWTGTYDGYPTGGDIDCDRSMGTSLPAQATFEQNGSTVVGTLTGTGPCGFDYTFRGILSGNVLTGGFEGSSGGVKGTLVGTTLEITVVWNSCACPGQVQLHR